MTAKPSDEELEKALQVLKDAGLRVRGGLVFEVKTFEVEKTVLDEFLRISDARDEKRKDAITEACRLYIAKYSADK